MSYIKGIYPVLFLLLMSACSRQSGTENILSYVDPDIGGVGLLLQPTRPTVQLPNQMIRMYPVREDYLDDQIRYFPLTLISHRNGELFGIMPFTGELNDKAPVSAWDNQLEVATPYYYSTWLEDYDITVDFAPGAMSGYFRIQYNDGDKKLFLAKLHDGIWQMTENKTLTAEERFQGMKARVHCELGEEGSLESKTIAGRDRQFVVFRGNSPGVIEFRYAVSFISAEQARQNLAEEMPQCSFEKTKETAEAKWESALGKIEVEGGTDDQKRTFYTALYRCYERMINITEGGKYYSNYDGKVHESARPFYVDDWIWDTFLALHPLRTILDPETESDMIQSYITMYEQSGWLPAFPILWGDNPCMNGFHSTIMILSFLLMVLHSAYPILIPMRSKVFQY